MGWSEQDEELAQEIQARVDAETSALKKQVAATQYREAKLRKALRNCYGLQGALDIPMIEATLNLPSNDTALQECIRAAQVAVLRDAARIPTRRWKGGPAGEAAIDIEAAISRMADGLEKSK